MRMKTRLIGSALLLRHKIGRVAVPVQFIAPLGQPRRDRSKTCFIRPKLGIHEVDRRRDTRKISSVHEISGRFVVVHQQGTRSRALRM